MSEPLHPSFTEQDSIREAFLAEAGEAIEVARTARLNPVEEKLSAASASSKPDVSSSDARQRPPATEAAPPIKPLEPGNSTQDAAGKIPGPPVQEQAEKSSSPASQLPQPDVADLPGPDAYKPGKGGAENWKKLHAAKDHWQQQAETLARQLEEVRTAPKQSAQASDDFTKQLTAIQTERDNLLARLEAVAVERSPRFEAAFKPRMEAAVAQAKAAVGPDRAKLIESVLALPEGNYRDEQIDALLGELGHGVRGAKLSQAVADLDRISAERTALASRGNDLYKQWQAEEQQAYQRQQQDAQAQASRTFDAELATWREAGYLKDDQQAALARTVFSGQADLTDAARASIWAVVGPQLASQAIGANKRIAELEAELSQLRAVQPSTAPDAGSRQPSGEEMPDGIGYGDAIGRLVQQSGLLR